MYGLAVGVEDLAFRVWTSLNPRWYPAINFGVVGFGSVWCGGWGLGFKV